MLEDDVNDNFEPDNSNKLAPKLDLFNLLLNKKKEYGDGKSEVSSKKLVRSNPVFNLNNRSTKVMLFHILSFK
jgi:hypothetical protein